MIGFTSERDFRRMAEAVKKVERGNGPPPATAKTRGASPIFARSTGTVVDDEFASGFIVDFTTGTAVDLGACYLTTIDGEPPAEGIYFGRITNLHQSSGDTSPLPVVRVVDAAGESPGSSVCRARGWWGGLRDDVDLSFTVAVTSASGACACVDDEYVSTMAFDTDSWDAADDLDVCGNDYNLSLTVPNGIPTLTLTDSSGGSGAGPTMTITAHCYGDGVAEFSFPGGPTNQDVCTETPETGCAGDNNFIIRVSCVSDCSGTEYDGAGWYIVLGTYVIDGVTRNFKDAVELETAFDDFGICINVCPGGPYESSAAALAAPCWEEFTCELADIVDVVAFPDEIEIEFFDCTGDYTALNGVILPMTRSVNLTYNLDSSVGGITNAQFSVLCGGSDPYAVYNLATTGTPQIHAGCGLETWDSLTGDGPTIELTDTDTDPNCGGLPVVGVISFVMRARS